MTDPADTIKDNAMFALAPTAPIGRTSKWRGVDDHYNTPRDASVPLIRTLTIPDLIWEPACGEGALSVVLEEHGHTVISTTTVDRGHGLTGRNFLEEAELLAPTLITNPPFNIINDFVEHAIRLRPDTLAIFAPTKFLESGDRYERIHSRTPHSIQYQFIERITFYAGDIPLADQPGWNTEAFSWFVWIKGWRREPITRWLNRDDGLQGNLF